MIQWIMTWAWDGRWMSNHTFKLYNNPPTTEQPNHKFISDVLDFAYRKWFRKFLKRVLVLVFKMTALKHGQLMCSMPLSLPFCSCIKFSISQTPHYRTTSFFSPTKDGKNIRVDILLLGCPYNHHAHTDYPVREFKTQIGFKW